MAEQIDGQIGQRVANGKSDGSGSATSSSSESSTATGTRGRGRPPGAKNKKSTSKSPGLVNVDVPKKEEQTDKPKPKPKPRKRAAAKKSGQLQASQVSSILLTVTSIIASKDETGVLAFTKDECDQIAEPLVNIMNKSEGVSNVTSEYADQIALLMAIATIMVPKLIMWQAVRPKKKKETKHEKHMRQQLPKEPSENKTDAGASRGNAPSGHQGQSNDTQFVNTLASIVPSTAGY